MGRLRNDRTDEPVELLARCIVGRTPLAGLRLDHRSVSREHAVIEWHGDCWRMRDLGSRNGTTINGQACSVSFHELARGDVLAFGDAEESWTLTDVDPPPPAAVSEDGTMRVGRGQVLLLPDRETPELSVHDSDDGWVCDDGRSTHAVAAQDTVQAGTRRWRLLLPARPIAPSTVGGEVKPGIDELTAVFEFDRAEEHVRLTLEHAGGRIALPPRAHDYLLLVLARVRLRDGTDNGLTRAEAGWTDSLELSKMLNTTPEWLNVQVFRARRQLAEHGVIDAPRIVERRVRTRQIRFGIDEIRLLPL